MRIAGQFSIGLAVAPIDMTSFLACTPILEVLTDLLLSCDQASAFPILKICAFLLNVQSETHALNLSGLDLGELGDYVDSTFSSRDVAAVAAQVAALLSALA
jgi:hypothetical protein